MYNLQGHHWDECFQELHGYKCKLFYLLRYPYFKYPFFNAHFLNFLGSSSRDGLLAL